jgi:hypothetical protein
LPWKSAANIGCENIGLRHWHRFATELRLDDAKLIDRIRTMAQAIPDQATAILEQIEAEGLTHVTNYQVVQTAQDAGGCMSKAPANVECQTPGRRVNSTVLE